LELLEEVFHQDQRVEARSAPDETTVQRLTEYPDFEIDVKERVLARASDFGLTPVDQEVMRQMLLREFDKGNGVSTTGKLLSIPAIAQKSFLP
jgi:hypothetical protein